MVVMMTCIVGDAISKTWEFFSNYYFCTLDINPFPRLSGSSFLCCTPLLTSCSAKHCLPRNVVSFIPGPWIVFLIRSPLKPPEDSRVVSF